MGNFHYRLSSDPGKTNKIFHHSSKWHVEISRIAKFGCEMCKMEKIWHREVCEFAYKCITHAKAYHFPGDLKTR